MTGNIEPKPDLNRVASTLCFFASVIKSGEPWTVTCENEFRAALAILGAATPMHDQQRGD